METATATTTRLHERELTERVIGGFYAVYNALRPGLLEAVYRRALVVELKHRAMVIATEMSFDVWYRGTRVGAYRADIVVANRLIVECKALDSLAKPHEAQLINYLHISGLPLGLLLNFGPTPQIRRLTRSSPSSAVSPQIAVQDPENP